MTNIPSTRELVLDVLREVGLINDETYDNFKIESFVLWSEDLISSNITE